MKEVPNAKGRIQQKMGAVGLKLQRRQLMLSGLYSVGVKNNGDMPHNRIVKVAKVKPKKLCANHYLMQ